MAEVACMYGTIARAINGPHFPVPADSKWSLEQLRDVLWGHLSTQEQASHMNEARAVVETILDLSAKQRRGLMDDGMRTTPKYAAELVRKHQPSMVGLILNLDRLSEYLDTLAAAQGIEARSDETLQAAQPEGREPGGEAMRQVPDSVHESAVSDSVDAPPPAETQP